MNLSEKLLTKHLNKLNCRGFVLEKNGKRTKAALNAINEALSINKINKDMNILSKGIISLNNGFNLKTEIENLLKLNNIEYKKIKFLKESAYQKNRYKKQYVGQEVWVTAKNNEKICITQDMFEECKNDNNLDFIKLMFD